MVFNYFAEIKRNRAIKKQARHDYESARGTAHLAILCKVRAQISQKIKLTERGITYNQEKIYALKRERANALVLALDKYIAYNRLTEVPGIGTKLRDTLLRRVFESRLSDLHHSFVVPGIGDARQLDISIWIQKYEQRKTNMLTQDFPGKNSVLREYDPKIKALYDNQEKFKSNKKIFEERYEEAITHINQLEQVTVTDFLDAIQSPGSDTTALDEYIVGLFPEWEPVPGWFKALMAESE